MSPITRSKAQATSQSGEIQEPTPLISKTEKSDSSAAKNKKKTNSKKVKAREEGTGREDRVSEGVTLYPVFCTAKIPTKILNEFIEEAHKGTFAMVDDGDVGAVVCLLDTENLDAITHGSRVPMKAFKSPFLGKTIDEIRTWMKDHKHDSFAQITFTILDEDTIKNKTCLVGYMGDDERLLVTDFYATMYLRVPVEMATVSWDEEEFVGTEKVYNRGYIEKGQAET